MSVFKNGTLTVIKPWQQREHKRKRATNFGSWEGDVCSAPEKAECQGDSGKANGNTRKWDHKQHMYEGQLLD